MNRLHDIERQLIFQCLDIVDYVSLILVNRDWGTAAQISHASKCLQLVITDQVNTLYRFNPRFGVASFASLGQSRFIRSATFIIVVNECRWCSCEGGVCDTCQMARFLQTHANRITELRAYNTQLRNSNTSSELSTINNPMGNIKSILLSFQPSCRFTKLSTFNIILYSSEWEVHTTEDIFASMPSLKSALIHLTLFGSFRLDENRLKRQFSMLPSMIESFSFTAAWPGDVAFSRVETSDFIPTLPRLAKLNLRIAHPSTTIATQPHLRELISPLLFTRVCEFDFARFPRLEKIVQPLLYEFNFPDNECSFGHMAIDLSRFIAQLHHLPFLQCIELNISLYSSHTARFPDPPPSIEQEKAHEKIRQCSFEPLQIIRFRAWNTSGVNDQDLRACICSAFAPEARNKVQLVFGID